MTDALPSLAGETVEAADTDPQIAGMIRGPGDVPVASVNICIRPADASSSCAVYGSTGSDGTYALHVGPGDYWIQVFGSSQFVPGYWSPSGFTPLQAEAGSVHVEDADVTGIDITLRPFPEISGTITDASGEPVSGMEVSGARNEYDITDSEGAFSIKVWPNSSSTIQLQTTQMHRGGWYGAGGLVADASLATAIEVAWSDVSGIDLEVPFWPRVTGRLTDAGGQPLAGFTVAITRNSDQAVTSTNSNGQYVLYARWGGSWTLGMDNGEAWIGKSSEVVADADVEVNAVMRKHPRVFGTVTDAHGDPVPGIEVVVGEWSSSRETTTDSNGMFSIWYWYTSPATVTYRDPTFAFIPGRLGPDGFAMNHEPSSTFTLQPDQELDASVTMPQYVQLSGHIRLADGTPVSGGWVGAGRIDYSNTAEIGSDGSFSLTVPPGQYTLSLPGGFAGEEGFAYHAGAAVPFAVGTDGRDVNVVLPAGSAIKGRVMAGSTPLPGIEVDVFLNGYPYTSTVTLSDGTYSVTVPPGAYLVGFYDPTGKYAHGWYATTGYTSDPAAGRILSVGPGGVTGVNVSLPTTRRISGKVIALESPTSTIPYAYVEAFVNGVFYSSQYATSGGSYNLPVAPGKVALWVYDTDLRYAPGWRASGGLSATYANAVKTLVGTTDLSGVYIKAPEAVRLELPTTWAPAPGSVATAQATIEAVAGGETVSFSIEDENLQKWMPVLAGSYRLWVEVDNEAYGLVDGWYKSGTITPDFAQATVRAFSPGAYRIPIRVPLGRRISGLVSDQSGAVVPSEVQLYVNGTYYTSQLVNGSFSFIVPPGTYRLGVVSPFGLHRAGWLGEAGFVTGYASAKALVLGATTDLSELKLRVPMDTPPAAPSAVVATPYHESAQVVVTPPAANPLRPIIHFAVTATPGGRQCFATTSTACTVTGLSNGTAYTFKATASSIVGSSMASPASLAVVPKPVPGAPGSLTAVQVGHGVQLTWAAAADHGSAVTGYVATISPGGATCSPTTATGTGCSISGLADGRYAASVKASNSVGSGPSATSAFTIDTTAPTNTVPAVALRAGTTFTASNVPVSVTWTAHDALTSIGDTSLELATGTGPYVDQPLASPTSTSLSRGLYSSTNSYRFRARATDVRGNTSGWAVGPVRYVLLKAETGSGIVYSGAWTSASSTSAVGGRYRYTTSRNASVSFTFTGRGFTFVTRKATSSGKAAVYVDGKLLTTVDLRASSTTWRWVGYGRNFSSSGTHVVKVVNLATSGRPRLNIDGFATIR